jgi:hypothetical protein
VALTVTKRNQRTMFLGSYLFLFIKMSPVDVNGYFVAISPWRKPLAYARGSVVSMRLQSRDR